MDRNEAIINGLVAQRNEALNSIVNLNADLLVAQGRIAELESRVAELTPKPDSTE